MNAEDIASQLRNQIISKGITLQQFLALADIATVLRKPLSARVRTGRGAKEWENKIRAVKRLQKMLGCELVGFGKHGDGGDQDPDSSLTEIGNELLEVTTRFFDDLHAVVESANNHGRSIRIASSTTLLQWLVSPSHPMLQDQIVGLNLPRHPEFAFSEIDRHEVQAGLASHAFHFVILRRAHDLDVTMMCERFAQPVAGLISQWAEWSDEQYKAWLSSEANPFHAEGAHAHRRFAIVLGKYDYIFCMKRGRREELEQQAKKQRRNWLHNLEVALCTNHPEFRARLLNLERQTGMRVAVRTDTWAQSAQMALHGGYATFLPSIARHSHPELVPLKVANVPPHTEEVIMIFNPSILGTRIFRQMLAAIAVSIEAVLNGPQAPEPGESLPGR